ncbi:MAG: RtcB family protein [Bacillota bacterium]|nr:RtcB family protein [Bacillota bacterium]
MLSGLEPAGKNRYRLPRREKMRADAVVYLNPALERTFQEGEALRQLMDAATLPGVVSPVIGLPDIHTGFGLPIGGVMATLPEGEGVISAGAVGMDINCGVRLLRTDIPSREVSRKDLQALLSAIGQRIPTGIGKKSRHAELTQQDLEAVLCQGARWLAEKGYTWPEDLERIEEGGCLAGADPAAVSLEARRRSNQLATLGGGNHFIEVGEVQRVYDTELAGAFGLEEGKLYFLIHTGSRGFGHQICTDYTAFLAKAAAKYGLTLPSRGLAAAPVSSPEGQRYWQAMACAVNFAFANRQLIAYDLRAAVGEVFATPPRRLGLTLVYDVAHNIAKFEEHGGRRLLVHRKGATRALPAGHPGNPLCYRETGHPVLVPGSMGTASYVLVGTPAAAETFFSVNHGAGRVLSRSAARRSISQEDFARSMGDVLSNAPDYRALVDEAPLAYKDIDEVVETLAEIGLTRKVARLVPRAVIKGEGEEG